ncbi:rhodanese-like domain-containing protein, partial [Klebsiella pneumoniae]|nr:rhodanese-like domain-containing protein [Klebsiella pneumoniae]
VSANGMELVKPAESLLKAGFERVFVLKDGLSGWTGDNLPLSRSKK